MAWGARSYARTVVAVVVALSFGSCFGRDEVDDTAPAMPHPALQRSGRDAVRANVRCTGCHVAIADEWRASMHKDAYVDPVYQRALAIEPLPFCRGCHAPEADPRADPPDDLGQLGVGCVTCHVPERDVATLGASGAGRAPHPVLVSAAFATEAACSGCHEFNFPTHAPGQPADKMQETVSEHAASPHASSPCATCHMPRVGEGEGRHASHGFSARSPSVLRSAALIAARRTDQGIEVSLEPARIGHAFPTGDLFRRLVVSAEAVGDDWSVIAEASRTLSRRFEWRDGGDGHAVRKGVGDDRVGIGGTRAVELTLGDAARERVIAWRVVYQRVEHPVGDDDALAVVAESVVIAEGTLPPGDARPMEERP